MPEEEAAGPAVAVQVVVDCADPAALAPFWAAALRYRLQPPPPGFATWPDFLASIGVPESEWNSANAIVDPAGTGPRLFFQRVPEGKAVKNRLHLDLRVTGGPASPAEERAERLAAESARLVALGATELNQVRLRGEHWIVMADPEGNEFCLT